MLLCGVSKELKNRRNPEIFAGIFLILTGIILFGVFLTRIEYITFFTSFSDDLEYLNDNSVIVQLNSLLWIISAFFMVITSASLMVSMNAYNELTTFIATFFFLLAATLCCFIGMKGLGVVELLVFQDARSLDLVENEYIKAGIISLTKEKVIFTRLANSILGIGVLFIGLFGFSTRRIPFILMFFSFFGGINLAFVSTFFYNTILFETGLLIVLITMVFLGKRIAFKGFIRKERKTKKML